MRHGSRKAVPEIVVMAPPMIEGPVQFALQLRIAVLTSGGHKPAECWQLSRTIFTTLGPLTMNRANKSKNNNLIQEQ